MGRAEFYSFSPHGGAVGWAGLGEQAWFWNGSPSLCRAYPLWESWWWGTGGGDREILTAHWLSGLTLVHSGPMCCWWPWLWNGPLRMCVAPRALSV